MKIELETSEHRSCTSVSYVEICRGCGGKKLPGRMLLPERQGRRIPSMTAWESPIIFFGTAPPFGNGLSPLCRCGAANWLHLRPNRPGPRKRRQVKVGPLSTFLGRETILREIYGSNVNGTKGPESNNVSNLGNFDVPVYLYSSDIQLLVGGS